MRLIHVLCMVLLELSVGSLLFASLLPPRVLRPSFFTLNCLIAAIAAAAALALSKTLLYAAWWEMRYVGLMVIGATIAWGCFRLDRPAPGRALMAISGLFGLALGVIPMAANALKLRGIESQATWLFDLGIFSGMLLLGVTHVGMLLGHWYLLMRRLSYEYLQRFAQLLLGAAAFRILVVILLMMSLRKYDPQVAMDLIPALWTGTWGFFFGCRVLLGLVAPIVLGLYIRRCVERRANQAATGLFYVTEICVLFGELFAAYLLI